MLKWFTQLYANTKPFTAWCGSWVPSSIVPFFECITWAILIIVFIKAFLKFGGADTAQLTEVLKAVVWPLVVVIALLAMRRPLGAFLTGLSQRITKLSAFNVELELATIKTSVVKSPALTALQQPTALQVLDSSSRIFAQIQDETRADYVVIDIGGGREWITSRLFIVASLFQRMRGIRCIVFLEGEGVNKGTFLGTADPEAVRWRLARLYPWLETALLKAFGSSFPNDPASVSASTVLIRNDEGAIDLDRASQIAENFIRSLQMYVQPVVEPTTWTQIHSVQPVWERAEWLTRDSLRASLDRSLNTASIGKLEERTNDEAIRSILMLPGPFVALIRSGHFDQLIDQQALLKELARQVAFS